MTVSQLVKLLEDNSDHSLHIMLPSGEFIPEHFHVTEVGRIHKEFIDCGGTKRELTSCLLQIWIANDFGHRLVAGKLSKILNLAKSILKSEDLIVEVEYGTDVATQYVLADVEITPKGLLFLLVGKHTACLAPDKCGINCC